MIAADQGMAVFAGPPERREMIIGRNLETIGVRRDVARGMQRESARHIALAQPFDQAATFARERGACFAFDPHPQRLRQKQSHGLDAATR